MATCAACGTPNPDVARFCMSCASPLAAAPAEPTREVRKVVTVVFADVTGSTGLGERLDPESLRAVMGRWFEAMRAVLERHGGTVEKFIGDAVVAVFGVPVLHEDDALRAVRAADEMGAALEALNEALRQERGLEIAMRVGVNTGEVVVGDARAGGGRATGDAVNVAARLQQAAEPGETLLGEATWRLVRDAVVADDATALQVRGRSAPVGARILRAVHSAAEAIPRRVGGPMVGRDRELSILRGAFERANAEDACTLVTVLGSPGVGKSRLVHEFLASVRDRALVARGRCLPYGDGITWLPVADLLRSAVGLADDADPRAARDGLAQLLADAPDADAVLDRLDAPLGLATAVVPREELFWGVRRFVERVAARRPFVLVIDDIQWAETTLLDLIEHLVDWVAGVPVLVVAMARPELLDTSTGWGGGKANAMTFRLEPLGQDQTESLVDALLEGAALPAEARARIAAAADGNPLYVEQMIEVLLDDGVLRRTDDGRLEVGDLEAITVPPTIQALLAARLDRLAEPDRRVIERAAVVGKEFRRVEVAELTPEPSREDVPARLRSLVRKELIRPDRSGADLDETFRFRHLLIRDAAYEGLPKAERADLHERFAAWLEASGDRLVEADEIIGYHLDQARTYRLALGPEDASTRALALRAGHLLAAAGFRALEREDYAGSERLLTRAGALLTDDPAGRFRTLQARVDTGWFLGNYRGGADAAEAMVVVAEDLGPLERAIAAAALASTRTFVDRTYHIDEAKPVAQALREAATAAGDLDALLEASSLEVQVALMESRWDECVRIAHEAHALALANGMAYRASEFSGWLSNAFLWGRHPVEDGVRVVRDLLTITTRRMRRLGLFSSLALLFAYAGDEAASREAHANAEAIRMDLGTKPDLFRVMTIEKALDHPAASLEAALSQSERLAASGETSMRSTVVCVAAQAQLRLGDLDAAFASAAEGEALAADDDVETHLLARSVRAIVLARRGAMEEAIRLTDAALEIGLPTDSLQVADAWLARAEVLSLAGDAAGSRAAAEEARAIWAAKGHVNGVKWAEEWL